MTVGHAGGSTLKTIGRFKCSIVAVGRRGEIYIDVVSRNNLNLFGLNAIDVLTSGICH